MINRDTIDRILEAARIEEVVSEFVQLKKSGSSYKGLSPWSQEKTPSFFVSPAKGIFKDFSSGKGGNVVSFLMELENMTYPEALRFLAKKYQIEVEEADIAPEKREELSQREALAVVNQFALHHFEQALWDTEEGKNIGLSYFRERGFTDHTIRAFALGYSADSRDHLIKTANAAGHQTPRLIQLGLAKEGETGVYDFFRGRVIFPIRNVSGRCIAFAGRTLRSDNKVKYLNSPETELYDKSQTLYGLYEAKRGIIQHDLCYLVEGYTDVISLFQAGVPNAVASSGTSLTPGQIKLIKRYTQNVTMLYDGDSAGVKAAMRGIDLLLEADMRVKVLLFPDGHDPDSFSKTLSQSELERFLRDKSVDFSDFMLEVLLKEAQGDPIQKAQASRRLLESISLVSDHIARSIYIDRASKQLGIPEQALYNELNKILRKKHFDRQTSTPSETEVSHFPAAAPQKTLAEADPLLLEKEVTRILINYGNREIDLEIINEADEKEQIKVPVAEFVLHDLEMDQIQFESPLYTRILDAYRTSIDLDSELPDTSTFINDHDPALSQCIAEMISSPYELSVNWESQYKIFTQTEDHDLKRTVFDPLMRLKLNRIRKMIQDLDKRLKEAGSDDELLQLMAEKIQLDKKKMEVSNFFGTTIM